MKKRFARAYSLGFSGFEGALLEVECQQSIQLPGFHVVGIPQNIGREMSERVRSALLACNYRLPSRKFTINLGPKAVKMLGTSLDLPVALACLASEGKISEEKLKKVLVIGELGLDGSLKQVPIANNLTGVIEKYRFEGAIVPFENSAGLREEHLEVGGGFTHLLEVINFLERGGVGRKQQSEETQRVSACAVDFAEIRGQGFAKRALLIAAAGEHHTLLLGPRGAGKSMLCSAFPGIFPPLHFREREEVRAIYNFCGQKEPEGRPFRRPHFSLTRLGLLGGSCQREIGELSLAHRGILFLDEILEIDRTVLECLRLPLEIGEIQMAKAHVQLRLPARALLLAAANRCPCGLRGLARSQCICAPREIRQYQRKLSHALLDRIDIRIPLQEKLRPQEDFYHRSTAELKTDAERARKKMIQRQSVPNGHLQGGQVFQVMPWSDQARHLLQEGHAQYELSERGLVGVARVALTISDLKNLDQVGVEELLEALHYRWQPEQVGA